MGTNVRLVGTGSAPTPGGEDPLGLVQDWLDLMESHAVYNMITVPASPTGQSGYAQHLNYDGIWTCWALSKLLSTQNPIVAAALFDYGELLCDTMWGSVDMDSGPAESGQGQQGFYNYNLGPYCYGQDPDSSPPGGSDPGQLCANFARLSAYSRPTLLLGNYVYGDNSYPSPTTSQNPTVAPVLAREMARAVCSHVIADSEYDAHDDLAYATTTYLFGHQLFIPRIVGHWFLGQDVDLQGGNAAIDQWRATTADLSAVDGDFSQVPATWSEPTTEYTPFMWAHVFYCLMAYYEDATFSGEPHDSYKALIPAAVRDLCDAAMAYFTLPTAGGRTALGYRVKPDGSDPDVAPDLSLWQFPMFAWAYHETGLQQYYDFAVLLLQSGINEGYITWGKRINQHHYGVWWGFQWLGWTSTDFALPWKYDLAGGDPWP